MKLTKRTKTQVKAQIKRKGVWEGHVCPSNTFPRPGQPNNFSIWVSWKSEKAMEDQLNTYTYYNCNNETGNYVHFYVEEE